MWSRSRRPFGSRFHQRLLAVPGVGRGWRELPACTKGNLNSDALHPPHHPHPPGVSPGGHQPGGGAVRRSMQGAQGARTRHVPGPVGHHTSGTRRTCSAYWPPSDAPQYPPPPQVMRDFTASQAVLLQQGGLSLEMLCALLNNNVEAYGQSLEFTEHVQVRARGGADVAGCWRVDCWVGCGVAQRMCARPGANLHSRMPLEAVQRQASTGCSDPALHVPPPSVPA